MKCLLEKIRNIILFLLMVAKADAQNEALMAMQKIYNAYNSGSTIDFNGTMIMYAKNNPGKIIEKMESSYTIKAMNFTCHIGPVLMLLNDNYYVSADKTLKLIVIGHRKDLPGNGGIPVLNIAQFKTWIQDKAIKASVIPQGNNLFLQLSDPGGISGYHLCSIVCNAKTGYMKKVLMEMDDYNDIARKTMVLEINYTVPVVKESSRNEFSERSFFSFRNNKIRITDNYKGYQVINQL
ncbi:MAG: hypothetical protein ABJC98_22405 [Bacteroidota bacterium]